MINCVEQVAVVVALQVGRGWLRVALTTIGFSWHAAATEETGRHDRPIHPDCELMYNGDIM